MLQLLMRQMSNVLHIVSLHFTPRTPQPTLVRLVSQMERVVPKRCRWQHQARLSSACVVWGGFMNRSNVGIPPLHAGGLLDPTDTLVAYLVRHDTGNGMPSQNDLAEVLLTLHEIALRPLPVLLDPGLVDGEIGSGGLTIGDGSGKCSESSESANGEES